jgi:hypothetical protein
MDRRKWEARIHLYKGFEIHRSEGQYPTYSVDSDRGCLRGVRMLREAKEFIDLIHRLSEIAKAQLPKTKTGERLRLKYLLG